MKIIIICTHQNNYFYVLFFQKGENLVTFKCPNAGSHYGTGSTTNCIHWLNN